MLGPPFFSASLGEKAENDTRLAGVPGFIWDVMGFLAYCTCWVVLLGWLIICGGVCEYEMVARVTYVVIGWEWCCLVWSVARGCALAWCECFCNGKYGVGMIGCWYFWCVARGCWMCQYPEDEMKDSCCGLVFLSGLIFSG